MKNKRRSGMWEYLEESGVLQRKNDSEIKAVKRAYRKQYLLNYKRIARKEKLEYTVCLSKKNGELQKIESSAKRHKLTVTRFIKESTLAYIEQKYLVPEPYKIAELEYLLSQCLNEIKTLVQGRTNFLWNTDNKIESIERRIIKLEENINDALRYPQRIK